MSNTTNKIQLTTEDGKPVDVSEEGSLGVLALGYVGVMLWREKRRQVREAQGGSGN